MFDSGDSTQRDSTPRDDATPRDSAPASGVLAGVPEVEWSAVLREQHAAIARAQFLEVDAVATVYLARCAADAKRGCNDAFQGEFAAAEVGLVYRWTEPTAHRVIGLGVDLRWRLHATSAAFAAGAIDQARAQTISDALTNVSLDRVDHIERLLLDGSDTLNTTKLRAKARRLIARHDPDAATRRRQQAEADRDIRFHANEDGTCTVDGTLPGPAGQIIAMRLRSMCFDVCADDPRSFAQRRADALLALATDSPYLDCRCGRTDCTAAGRTSSECTTPTHHAAAPSFTARPLPPTTVHVGVNLTTLLSLDDLPGYLAGHGWIDADLARELSADGTWRRVLTLTDADREAILDALCGHTGTEPTPEPAPDRGEPFHPPDTPAPEPVSDDAWLARRRAGSLPHGAVVGIGRALRAAGITPTAIRERTAHRREQLTYRPSARLAEIVRTRDGTCRFPGCSARAATCDLDHTVPFDHADPGRGGRTVEQNLACLCRRHHRLKTSGLWTVRQLGGGRLEWTAPTGEFATTDPAGAFSDDTATVGAADRNLAESYGLTLTDPLTLDRLFDPHHGRGVEADLRYVIDAHPRPGPSVVVPATPIEVDLTDPTRPTAREEPAPF
ncbi:DUF222 domain-containing protein [Rhodococcus sp. NPDC058532]|uniref:HNH endonuclease signature motif containing protein n=1 Tax=Rhodococcus sp. NPDC058532 TaxID=3346540 RepID=UPI00365995E0